MWLITDIGFFSAVQKHDEQNLTIRARVREDLEALRDRYLPSLGEILEGVGSDYRFRAEATHEAFAEAVKKAALEIDYPNFKNSVANKCGRARASIYSKVWGALLDLR